MTFPLCDSLIERMQNDRAWGSAVFAMRQGFLFYAMQWRLKNGLVSNG